MLNKKKTRIEKAVIKMNRSIRILSHPKIKRKGKGAQAPVVAVAPRALRTQILIVQIVVVTHLQNIKKKNELSLK